LEFHLQILDLVGLHVDAGGLRACPTAGALVLPGPARYLPRLPVSGWSVEASMRADVETAAADIEQSIELLRRRL
jgi:hypothetical protein